MSKTMKITNKPNANGHFIKLCNAYGIRLDGNFLTKKYSIYGRDEKGLFYCDMFPNYNGKKTPKLKVWRYVAQHFDWGTLHSDAKWVCSEESGSTVARIWHLYNKMGRLRPLAYKDLDCKRNNKIQHSILCGNAKHGKQKRSPWGTEDFCSWKKENAGMIETVPAGTIKKVGV